MQQLIAVATGKVAVVDVPRPVITPGEMLVQLTMCGICGTDLMKVYSDTVAKPVHLGHEVVGTVAEIGEGVAGFVVGQRVALMHHVPDYGSHATRRGSATMDRQFKQTDFDPGGFAEFIRLSSQHVQYATCPIPDDMPDARAVFAEPLTCVLRALDRVDVRAGDTVCIVGVGAIGLLFVPLLRDQGARVVACDVRTARLDAALAWGADQPLLITPGELAAQPAATIPAPTVPPCDLVVLTVLTPETLTLAQQLIRDGGTILLFGAKPDTVIPLDLWQLWRREINIISSYGSTPDLLPRALAILRRATYKLEETISHQMPLGRGAEAFELMHRGQASKVAITSG